MFPSRRIYVGAGAARAKSFIENTDRRRRGLSAPLRFYLSVFRYFGAV
jgi:hypothetical protein